MSIEGELKAARARVAAGGALVVATLDPRARECIDLSTRGIFLDAPGDDAAAWLVLTKPAVVQGVVLDGAVAIAHRRGM